MAAAFFALILGFVCVREYALSIILTVVFVILSTSLIILAIWFEDEKE